MASLFRTILLVFALSSTDCFWTDGGNFSILFHILLHTFLNAVAGTPCEANSEIYKEFARAVFEVREVSQREVLLPTPRLDFVGIWICHVFLTWADFILFDLATGSLLARVSK